MKAPIRSESVDWSAYRLPAEWEKHEATFLAWPHNAETWPGLLEGVEKTYLHIIQALLPGEKVYLLAKDCSAATQIQERLTREKISSPNLKILTIPSDDAWVRDSGPIFVLRRDAKQPQRLAHDFIFNSWGRKYGPWDLDDVIPPAACRMLDIPWVTHDFVLEGGSLDTDGQGTLLTTEQCLLNPNRNPSLRRTDIEERLARWLGIRKVIWLHDGLEGDDTDGHIDDITRFVAPGMPTTRSSKRTSPAFARLKMPKASHCRSSNCPCPLVPMVPITAIQLVMPISISVTPPCWFQPLPPPPMPSCWIGFAPFFLTVKSSGSTAEIWWQDWERFTASRNKCRPFLNNKPPALTFSESEPRVDPSSSLR